jgi:PAS domain S-box-containing protein
MLLEASLDAMLVATLDGRLEWINHQTEVAFNYSRDELIGQPIGCLLPERYRPGLALLMDAARAAPGSAEQWSGETVFGVRKDGGEFPVSVSVSRIDTAQGTLLFVTMRDATEYRKAETELRLARKLKASRQLEAIGQLAAGIAHEINTPMQYIGDSVHFLRQSFEDLLRLLDAHEQSWNKLGTEPDLAAAKAGLVAAALLSNFAYVRDRAPRAFERTVEGIQRVTEIVRAMKEFAHPYAEEKSPMDINRALGYALTVSRNEYRYVAEVETDLGEIPSVPCHVGEINQVFLNLIINAAHSIADVVGNTGGKGRIRVRTFPGEEDDETVIVQISDTGTGIPEEIRHRVFEPFFTTKPAGKGTGQGLAISRSIVVKHGGALTFESAIGVGTTFEIRLPSRDLTGGMAANNITAGLAA